MLTVEDVSLPGVKIAVAARLPAPGGRVKRFDATAAPHFSITFGAGRIAQFNVTDCEVARSDNDLVNVATQITPRGFDDHATAAGEPGVPHVVPAIAIGLFHATGQRKRQTPFSLQA